MNRTFSEELISEWLQLNGWHIQTGVALRSKKVGGRDEADIVGLKILDGVPHILHVEVGTLGGSVSTNLKVLKKKFSEKKQKYIKKVMGLKNANFQSRYIATYLSSNIEEMREIDNRIDKLSDVIQYEILPDITKWKASEVNNRKTTRLPTPPNNLWLIQLIDYMAVWSVDLSPYWGMKSSKTREWVLSKSGVKVYRKPKYHPQLKDTDLAHPDFIRKSKEVFPNGKAKGLPKICSENSEDAKTWHFFSPLIKASPQDKERWLQNFLTRSLDNFSLKNDENLGKSDILPWRGKEAEPYYNPPPNLPYKEGKTEVDVTIKIPNEAIVFVEAKYKSSVSKRTKHDPDRDQIIRNIDIGTFYASNENLGFYFILLTEELDHKSKKIYNYYKKDPQNIINKLQHRTDLKNDPSQFDKILGHITWDQMCPLKE